MVIIRVFGSGWEGFDFEVQIFYPGLRATKIQALHSDKMKHSG